MPNSVAIIGIGFTPAQPTTAHCSFKEMMFETAQKAYLDAGVEANEIDSFVISTGHSSQRRRRISLPLLPLARGQ